MVGKFSEVANVNLDVNRWIVVITIFTFDAFFKYGVGCSRRRV